MRAAWVCSPGYAALYPLPGERAGKLCDLPPGARVMAMESPDSATGWMEVLYQAHQRTWRGYTLAENVERWVSPARADILRIRHATPGESDFAQNLIYLGQVQYNLCGQFCVLYCAGWEELDVEAWLEVWKLEAPSFFQRIFSGGRSRPTGVGDLVSMLHTFDGYPESFLTLGELFACRGRPLFTPGRLESALTTCRLLTGVKVESRFGRLAASGIAHWVVLEKVRPEARGGLVELYNPASNGLETYTWEQLESSATRSPFGLAVPR